MIDFATQRFDSGLVRRAFDAADSDGEAALNALLYAAGALMMSAVLLITTSPALVGIALAVVPWLMLAAAGWLWISPAIRDQVSLEQRRSRRADEARDLAADVLLDDEASPDQRRKAARFMLGTGKPGD